MQRDVCCSRNGEAIIHKAAAYGRKSTVELLISKGADVHAKEDRRELLHMQLMTMTMTTPMSSICMMTIILAFFLQCMCCCAVIVGRVPFYILCEIE